MKEVLILLKTIHSIFIPFTFLGLHSIINILQSYCLFRNYVLTCPLPSAFWIKEKDFRVSKYRTLRTRFEFLAKAGIFEEEHNVLTLW